MNTDFYRIKRLPPYIFEEVNRIKARLRAEGTDIIDFGMGNPDMPTPPHIVEKMIETVQKPRTNRYSASKGIPGLRKAMANYYGYRFGVKLDPDREVIATLGSKEGFANLAQAITAPGDVVICPNPAYPIHAYGFIMAGGVIRHVPALSPEQYLSGIDRAVRNSVPKPIAMIVSYPSNPTAQWVPLDFYKEVVALAKKHDLIVLSDVAYGEIYFDNNPPPSILQVEGAKDCAVEINSLSKTYAMAGWRVGMVVGNEKLCAALAGWDIPAPPASMFAWAPLPKQYEQAGSMLFSKLLIEEAGVAVAPGVGFGEFGEGFVRVGLVENEHRIRQAARNVRKFLANADEILARHHNQQAAQ
jgi:alanine-synthesizing transaminase